MVSKPGLLMASASSDDEKKRKEQQKTQGAEQRQAERQQQWVRFRSEQNQAAANFALLKSVRRENLYILEGDAIEGCAAVAKAEDDMKSWQMRLGHRDDRSLSELCNRGLLGNCTISKRHVSFDVPSSGRGGINSGGGSLRKRLVEKSKYVSLSCATISTECSGEIAMRKGNTVDMLRRVLLVFH